MSLGVIVETLSHSHLPFTSRRTCRSATVRGLGRAFIVTLEDGRRTMAYFAEGTGHKEVRGGLPTRWCAKGETSLTPFRQVF